MGSGLGDFQTQITQVVVNSGNRQSNIDELLQKRPVLAKRNLTIYSQKLF